MGINKDYRPKKIRLFKSGRESPKNLVRKRPNQKFHGTFILFFTNWTKSNGPISNTTFLVLAPSDSTCSRQHISFNAMHWSANDFNDTELSFVLLSDYQNDKQQKNVPKIEVFKAVILPQKSIVLRDFVASFYVKRYQFRTNVENVSNWIPFNLCVGKI